MIDSILKGAAYGEAVRFGRQLFLYFAVFLLMTLVLCLQTSSPGQSVIAVFTFLILRAYAGGMHLRSERWCLLFSVLIMAFLLFLTIEISMRSFAWMSLALLLLSPVSHPDRPLSVRGKMKAKRICACTLFSIFVLVAFFPTLYALEAKVVLFTLGLQIMGFVKERIQLFL